MTENSAAATEQQATGGYSLTRAIISAVICIAVGSAFFWLHTRLAEQMRKSDADRAHSKQLKDEMISTKQAVEQEKESRLKRDDSLQRSREESARNKQRLEEVQEVLTALRDDIDSHPNGAGGPPATPVRPVLIATVRAEAEETATVLRTLQTEATAVREKLESLMTSEQGRRIAAIPDQTRVIATAAQRERPSDEKMRRWENALAELLKQSTYSDENLDDVRGLGQQVRDELNLLMEEKMLVEVLLKKTATTSPVEGTLAEAIKKLSQDDAAGFDQRIRTVKQAAEDKMAEQLDAIIEQRAAAWRALNQQRIENEVAQFEAKAQELKDQGQANSQAFAKARAKAKLLREMQSDMPRIQSLLAPFINPGYNQTGNNRSPAKEPMSLGAIAAYGGLDPTTHGLRRLHQVGGTHLNDRPRGSFPRYVSHLDFRDHPTYQGSVHRAQQLLIKYGDLLVEQGLLRR